MHKIASLKNNPLFLTMKKTHRQIIILMKMVEEILKLVKHMNKVEKIENSHFKRLIIITGLIHTQHALKIQDKEVIINKIFMNENINFYMI